MVDTLALAGGYSLVVGGLYAFVGSQIARREVPPEALVAHRMFLVWWFAFAASSLLGAINIALYRLDALAPGYYLAATQANILAIVLALLGLLYYMVYLYTGSSRWFRPIVLFYVLFYLALLALVAYRWSPPEGFTDNGWSIQALPEPESDLHPAVAIPFLLLLVGPQIAAAVAFLRLAPRLDEPTPRYRVRLVGTAILLWFGASLVASIVGNLTDVDLSGLDAWQVLTRVLGLSAVLLILAAYKPPAWVRRRYGVESV